MENLFLPNKIELKKGADENEGVLVIEPLFHGYGTTIGNALRRVLLSSLPGAAVTSFKIKGATHEFSAVKGVHEDVLQIVLNLKQLRLKMFVDEPVILKIVKKGEGDVTGADIEKNSSVQIINPDLKIATVTDKIDFNMEITVEKGLGFDPTENRDKTKLPVGAIAIDAIFTPIRDISIKVEDTRVGQITNFDKLTMDIKTDGTITPSYAINFATKLLIDHFSLLTNEANIPVEMAREVKAEAKKAKKTKTTTKKSKK
jgi:DNA-directed RNA polymerase subunit alpha